MPGERILIAEDDDGLRQVVAEYLSTETFVTIQATNGLEALRIWHEQRPDLLLLDWMMPELSGLDVARQVRQQSKTPIIFLTARADESDKLLGLELGADDYLTKPFSMRELTARIRAVLRRTQPEATTNADIISFGEITLDLAAHSVFRNGEEILLTKTEYKILVLMARNPNRVFSRLQLMEAADADYYEGFERTMDSHISHLRSKLGIDDPLIQTVKGAGYKLVPPRR